METAIVRLAEVDSTNNYGRDRFDELADGTLVAADYQTAGRGRLGRKWVSPPGTNLMVTYVMKQVSAEPFYATCCSSLAVLEMLREAAPDQDFYVKWPNDVYCGDAKIAGILCEGIIRGGCMAGIAAGMGVNVNLSAEAIAELDQSATSLKVLCGKDFDVTFLLYRLAKSLNACYILYSQFPGKLFERWKSENRLLGKRICFTRPDGSELDGVMRGILADGSIEVESAAGREVLRCGDIRIVKGSWDREKTKV